MALLRNTIALKRFLKFIVIAVGIMIGLLLIYVIAGLTLHYIPVNKNADYQSPNDVTIYLLSNGVHTDVVVPVKNEYMDWGHLLKFEHTDTKDTMYRFVGIGWGDKGFYMQTPEWKDLKISVALRAALHLGTAAIHATFYHIIDTTDPNCVVVHISKEDYIALAAFIKNSFLYDSSGSSIHIPSTNDGYGDSDAFYEAKGSYSLFYTCNTWTNNALKAANQKAAWWALLDKGILYHYKK